MVKLKWTTSIDNWIWDISFKSNPFHLSLLFCFYFLFPLHWIPSIQGLTNLKRLIIVRYSVGRVFLFVKSFDDILFLKRIVRNPTVPNYLATQNEKTRGLIECKYLGDKPPDAPGKPFPFSTCGREEGRWEIRKSERDRSEDHEKRRLRYIGKYMWTVTNNWYILLREREGEKERERERVN